MRASSAFRGVYEYFGFQDARVIRMEIGRLDMVGSAQTHQHQIACLASKISFSSSDMTKPAPASPNLDNKSSIPRFQNPVVVSILAQSFPDRLDHPAVA